MQKTQLLRSPVILAACLTVACGPRAPVSRAPAVQPPPVTVPAGTAEYRLVPGESEIRVLVYRAGPLARLGHNHVISTTTIDGKLNLASPVTRSSVSLAFPAASLQVDVPAQRAEEGDEFPGELEPAAIDATRANMLGAQLLDAAAFPDIKLRSRAVVGQLPALELTVDVQLRGEPHSITVPVQVVVDDQRVEASGSATVRHADLGLEPFSVGLGALSVRDELELKFRLVAHAAE